MPRLTLSGDGTLRQPAKLSLLSAAHGKDLSGSGQDDQMIGAGRDATTDSALHQIDGRTLVTIDGEAHVAMRVPERAPSEDTAILQQTSGMRVSRRNAQSLAGQIDKIRL